MLLEQITLKELIALNKDLKPLDDKIKAITASEDSDNRKNILLTKVFIQKAQITYQWFGEKSTQGISNLGVDFLVGWYNDFIALFDMELPDRWWKSLELPAPELTHVTDINFGQLIDAKMIVEAGSRDGRDKWQIVQYIMSIFLLGKKKKYDYLYTNENNRHFILCGNRTVVDAIKVSKWWDVLNIYIKEHYTVFQEDGDVRDNSENIDEHMRRWGWVNFLKSIAKTKAFDIAGSKMNSIDCVRETKASEILIWASEEKDHNVAVSRDMKSIK